ncbi:MAG: hypothetical protein LBL35_02825 [Clostridiales bacterium]|jgi:hypothetical protein|nr:hypothetical protein [Clostridiales bacterium]
MEVKQVTNEDQLKYFYQMRYKVFIEGQKNAPKDLFPDGLFKDDEDDYAFHLGCYEGATLLGGVSVVIKNTPEAINRKFNEVEREPFNIVCEKESAAIKILMVIDENVGNDIFIRGRVLENLFVAVNELIVAHNVKYSYLIAVENTKGLYEKIGYTQIGDFRLYKGMFWTCPMKLTIENGRPPNPTIRDL